MILRYRIILNINCEGEYKGKNRIREGVTLSHMSYAIYNAALSFDSTQRSRAAIPQRSDKQRREDHGSSNNALTAKQHKRLLQFGMTVCAKAPRNTIQQEVL